MSQFTTSSINEAIRHLEAAKHSLVGLTPSERKLESLLEEKQALERDIAELKYEKRDLEISIDCLKLRHKVTHDANPEDEGMVDFTAVSGDDSTTMMINDGGDRTEEDKVHPTGEELEDNEDKGNKTEEEEDTDNNGESDYAFENVSVVERKSTEDTIGGHSVASGTTTSSNKKRRVSKAFVNSPKKWRRMIRSHRLKSILLRA